LGLHFFGLNKDRVSESRIALFREIHQIVFHGNGGYDWHTVYNMPNWLRHFTFHEIKQYNTPPEEQDNGGNTKTVIGSDGTIKLPELIEKAHNNKKTSYK
jgi:hypothetical protein